VRLKNSGRVLGTEDYGSRQDVFCMSTEVLGINIGEAEMVWLYPKKSYYNEESVGKFMGKGIATLLPLDLVNKWNDRFREMGGTHPNVSTGMAAIITAADHLRPETIVLAGFDTLLDPKIPFTRNDDIPRTGIGTISHDWDKEHELLKILSDHYGFNIGKL
jgi:hypothetical protein